MFVYTNQVLDTNQTAKRKKSGKNKKNSGMDVIVHLLFQKFFKMYWLA